MKVLRNETADYLTANFSETETLWLVTDLYNYADERRYGHYIYKYAGVNGTNTTDNPEVDSALLSPSWVEIAPTNYYAMLDGRTNTKTVNADTIEITISSSNYDAISLLGIVGSSVSLFLYDNVSASPVYTNVIDLQDETGVVDEYSYWFSDFVFIPVVYDDNMPLYTDSTLTIIIDNTGSNAECGRLVFGRSFYVGDTGYGSNLTLESYSRKEVDVFGNETLVQRGSVNLDSYEVLVPTSKIPSLRRKAKELDAIAILFIMDESITSNLENLLNFGYWADFTMLITSPSKSTISLTIKGIL